MGNLEVTEDPRRDETAFEKLDRNWNEILQELRVMQTGTQIVTAFLIVLPFQARFEELVAGIEHWYMTLMVSAVLLTVLMLMPVVIHRRYFRLQVKDQTVTWGNRFLKICLVGLAVLLAGCVTFISHIVLPDGLAWIVGGGTALVIAVLMVFLPPRSSVPGDEDVRSAPTR